MSRKSIIIIIVSVIILVGLLGGFYYYLMSKSTVPGSPDSGFTIRDLFPFGKAPVTPTPGVTGTPDTSNQNNNPQQNPDVSNVTPPVLRHISSFPIAGSIIFDRIVTSTTTSTTTGVAKVVIKKEIQNFIRYMERSTGNIYETATNTLATVRISNTTFPKVYEAFFDSTATNLIARTLKDDDSEIISTYYGHLQKETPTSTVEKLETRLLSDNVNVAILSPSKNRMFSLGSLGGEKGVISNLDGSQKSQIWTSFLKEWQATWANEGNIVLSTKPSANVESVSYLLNIATRSFRKIGNALPGLTVSVSPDLASILYAQSDNQNRSLIFGLMDRGGKAPTSLFIKTLPEKCVWSIREKSVAFCAVPDTLPSAAYPDDWYQGKISFFDSIWKINVVTGEARDIAPIREMVKEDIDAINLSLDTKEDYLLFTNKRDLSLWGLKLK